MAPRIEDAGLKFTKTPTRRSRTDTIVLHHTATEGSTAESIHRAHLANGWIGIGYHYVVYKDGRVFRGRPENTVGAHAGSTQGYNSRSIGVVCVGDYETTQSMPAAQYAACVALVRDILTRYPGCAILRHQDTAATACPGRYFPVAKMKEDVMAKDLTIPEAKKIIQDKCKFDNPDDVWRVFDLHRFPGSLYSKIAQAVK